MIRILSTVIAGALLVAVAPAAAYAEASPKALALARRYVAALEMEKTMDGMMKGLIPAMVQAQAQRQSNLSPEKRQAIMEAAGESSVAMMPKIMERYIPVMADMFTEQELEALVNFYESPVGRSIVAKLPAMGPAVGKVTMDMMPEMQADMMRRVCSKIDCTPQNASAKPKAS